jgi:hypothetical protein
MLAALVLFISMIGLVVAQEIQIPFSTHPEVTEITRILNNRYHLVDKEGFERAFLFQLPDSTCVMEVYYTNTGRVYRERQTVTPERLSEIRNILSGYTPSLGEQVNFCDFPEIDFIDANMNDHLALLPVEPDFDKAYLYRMADSSYLIEVFHNRPEGTTFDRRPIPREKVEKIRATLSTKRTASDSTEEDRARRRYLWECFKVYFGFHTWAIPATFGMKGSDTGYGGIIASFMYAGDNIFTRRYKITPGVEALASHGFYGGAIAGLGISALFKEHPTFGGALAGSIAGHGMGWIVARKYKLRQADAQIIGSMGTYGATMGFTTAQLTNEPEGRTIAAFTLVGQAAGYTLASKMKQTGKLTVGDAEAFKSDCYVGPALACALFSSYKDTQKIQYIAPLWIGSFAGVMSGWRAVTREDMSRSQGMFYSLSPYCGYTFGLGVATSLKGSRAAKRIAGVGTAILLHELALRTIHKDNIWADRDVLGLNKLQIDPSGILSRSVQGENYTGSLVTLSYPW